MDRTYSTSEIARIIGIHSNTVRFYEKMELITKPDRLENGYRIFTELHIRQFRIARLAFRVEVLQNGLRKQAISIVKACAQRRFADAISFTDEYLSQLQREQMNAEEAITITEDILAHSHEPHLPTPLKRKEAADLLGITVDTMRNWEMNGLIDVRRASNSYRIYTGENIARLKIIRSLRCANYSLSSILRLMRTLSVDPTADIGSVIDIPKDDEDMITACDRLISSLEEAQRNACQMRRILISLEEDFG